MNAADLNARLDSAPSRASHNALRAGIRHLVDRTITARRTVARKLAALAILGRSEVSQLDPLPFRVRLTGAAWCGTIARQNARLMEWPELAQRPAIVHAEASARTRPHLRVAYSPRAVCGKSPRTSAITCAGCCEIRDAVHHGETLADAITAHDVRLIAETVAQDWPRCGGDSIDAADVWAFAGFDDDQVIAWLEAGVPRAAAAVRLDRASVTARQVGRQFEIGVTLGLAYTRGDVSLEQVRSRS